MQVRGAARAKQRSQLFHPGRTRPGQVLEHQIGHTAATLPQAGPERKAVVRQRRGVRTGQHRARDLGGTQFQVAAAYGVE